MGKLTELERVHHRFQVTMDSVISNFRAGDDARGLDDFLAAIEDFEILLKLCWCREAENVSLERVLSVLKELGARIKNQDMVGMTDILEFHLNPVVKELIQSDGNKSC